jgi:hypothetical protein
VVVVGDGGQLGIQRSREKHVGERGAKMIVVVVALEDGVGW